MLNEPLPWQKPEEASATVAEIEGEAFMSFMGQHQQNTAGAH